MNPAVAEIAERLADEFPDEATATVVRVLTSVAEGFPDADLMFVEQAARARLSQRG